MPTDTPGSQGADPFAQARAAARELARRTGSEHHDVLVVLGTALSSVASSLGAAGPGFDLTTLPWFPRFTGPGHSPTAWSVQVGARHVLLAAGRLHLYEGCDVHQVVHLVRTAVEGGCRTVVLTNAAGGINPELAVGETVLIADHLNLTATSPLTGFPALHPAGSPFVSLVDAWSPRLRAAARRIDPDLREGIYAQLPGPHFETPAEIRMLAALGADLVGMSTVPEAIAARHLGAEVLGLSVVTNHAAGTSAESDSFDDIGRAAAGAVERLGRIVRGVVEGLDEP
jgi:purine-nucleoside phosphorylase